MTKRKDERRELLKEDEILSKMEKIARYMQQNPMQVGLILAGILGLALLLSIMQERGRAAVNERAATLYKAEKILQTDISDENAELKFASQKE